MKPSYIFNILKLLVWVLFIGFCIRTGSIFLNSFIGFFFVPEAAEDLYDGLDLSGILDVNPVQYILFSLLLILESGLKAFLFYHLIKIMSKINISHPFSELVAQIIGRMCFTALYIGAINIMIGAYVTWLDRNSLAVSFENDASAFLVMAGILYVIMQIFKRGLELQSENELTV